MIRTVIIILSLITSFSKILSILINGTVSKAEIATTLGYKSIVGNIKIAVNELLNKNFIGYTIPQKPRSKNQKYFITQKSVKKLKILKK